VKECEEEEEWEDFSDDWNNLEENFDLQKILDLT